MRMGCCPTLKKYMHVVGCSTGCSLKHASIQVSALPAVQGRGSCDDMICMLHAARTFGEGSV
jgi:hypothetical protein